MRLHGFPEKTNRAAGCSRRSQKEKRDMKIRTLFALLLAAVMLTALLAGCDSKSKPKTPAATNAAPAATDAPANQTEPHTEAPTTEATDAPETPTEPETDAPTSEPMTLPTDVDFEELTVVDNDECTIKITGVDPDSFWGFTLNVFLENKNADLTYMFSVDNASINGVQSDPLFAAEVAPGKKSNEDVTWMSDTLKEMGVPYTDLELTFTVSDADDWTADDIVRETVHVYPYGEEAAKPFERKPQPTDVILADNESCRVTVIGCGTDLFGYNVNLLLENKTDVKQMFTADNVSVNGYMIDPYWACILAPGCMTISSMSFGDLFFEENQIETVEKVEMQFCVSDYDDTNGRYFNDTVTFQP